MTLLDGEELWLEDALSLELSALEGVALREIEVVADDEKLLLGELVSLKDIEGDAEEVPL